MHENPALCPLYIAYTIALLYGMFYTSSNEPELDDASDFEQEPGR